MHNAGFSTQGAHPVDRCDSRIESFACRLVPIINFTIMTDQKFRLRYHASTANATNSNPCALKYALTYNCIVRVRIVKRTSVVSLPIAEAFQVFSDPSTAELLMPPTMRFRLTNEVDEPIKAGTIIQYRFYFYFIPLRWRLRVESVEPPNSFVYVQQRGPFGHWRHLETFSKSGDKATQVRDRFEFVPPFGRFGEFVYHTFFKVKITQLFEYRANQMDRVSRGGALQPTGAPASPKRAPKPQSS